MAGTGAKKVVISCTGDKSVKSVVFKKTRNESLNVLACPVFELRMLIMLKRVSYIACETSVHESVILKRTRNINIILGQSKRVWKFLYIKYRL